MYYFYKGLPDISLSIRGHLQADILQAEMPVPVVIIDPIAWREGMFFPQRRPVPRVDPSTIVQMLQMSCLHDLKQVRTVPGFQQEYPFFFPYHISPPGTQAPGRHAYVRPSVLFL